MKWDKIGAAISSLCILHCVLLPVGLLFVPAMSTLLPVLSGWVHAILLLMVVTSAVMAMIPGYQKHRHLLPASLGAAGSALLFVGLVFCHEFLGHEWEPVFAITGSLFLISAHWVNHLKCNECSNHCSEHHH